ncbi:hypothetical protein POVWA2_023180 [Plasmodium ovale wallikeri]|uniref:Uncharacterized protein n=1 Tax=Plasmodium ovale wallikeri TaxID=864142 RepID=A0A1A8YTX2_PLAOA|nr:hypothetical protein POVWA2_023180 [Plasmodium ovale wallikeri]
MTNLRYRLQQRGGNQEGGGKKKKKKKKKRNMEFEAEEGNCNSRHARRTLMRINSFFSFFSFFLPAVRTKKKYGKMQIESSIARIAQPSDQDELLKLPCAIKKKKKKKKKSSRKLGASGSYENAKVTTKIGIAKWDNVD